MRVTRHSTGLLGLVAVVALSAGFLMGSQLQPAPLNSELADAQVVAQDRDVRWVAYGCGDDNATLLTREMPNVMECRQVRRLSEIAEFPVPPRQ
jgi:hypothetical protein